MGNMSTGVVNTLYPDKKIYKKYIFALYKKVESPWELRAGRPTIWRCNIALPPSHNTFTQAKKET
jgi:hypothetical protein